MVMLRTYWRELACILGGLSVLCFSRPALPLFYQGSQALYVITIIIWAHMLLLGIVLIHMYSRQSRLQRLLVWCFFAAGLHPLVSGNVYLNWNFIGSNTGGPLDRPSLFILRYLNVGAFITVLYGLMRFAPLHPLLVKIEQAGMRVVSISPRLLLAGLCAVFIASAVGISWYCYRFLPAIPDTVTQLQHAKIFAGGDLYGVAPLMKFKEFFPLYVVVEEGGKWYSSYQPLHILFLAIGTLFHAPWLVTPIMGALAIILSYTMAKRCYGVAPAYVAAILAFLSPLVLFMSSEYMSHASALALCMGFIVCFFAMLDATDARKARKWAAAAGLIAGGVFLMRPLTAVALVTPYALYMLWLICKHRKKYIMPAACAAIAGLLCLLFQLWYNLQLTGEAWYFPYVKANPANIPGFTLGHNLPIGLSKAIMEWGLMNQMLFEWFIPCSVFAIIALFLRRDRYSLLLFATIVSMTVFNVINRFASFTWGPRYIYEAAGPMIVLSAVGLCAAPALIAKIRFFQVPLPVARGGLIFLVAVLFAAGWAVRIPETIRIYAANYQNVNPGYAHHMTHELAVETPAVIFVRHKDYKYLEYALPAFDSDERLFAVDRGEANCQLLGALPGRHAYREVNGKAQGYFECALPSPPPPPPPPPERKYPVTKKR